jgi:hypothetical protein
MSAQSKALWLADWLDVRACGGNEWNAKMNAAAAELRRLVAQRDALLEALKASEPYLRHADVAYNVYVQARAAIKKAEEST